MSSSARYPLQFPTEWASAWGDYSDGLFCRLEGREGQSLRFTFIENVGRPWSNPERGFWMSDPVEAESLEQALEDLGISPEDLPFADRFRLASEGDFTTLENYAKEILGKTLTVEDIGTQEDQKPKMICIVFPDFRAEHQ